MLNDSNNKWSVFDFDTQSLGDMGMIVPQHARDSLYNYFMQGWQPGGFLTAVLAGDLFRAVSSADTVNRQMMWVIAHWIMLNAPQDSWGSYKAVDNWVDNKHNCRTNYTNEVNKKVMWNMLKDDHNA